MLFDFISNKLEQQRKVNRFRSRHLVEYQNAREVKVNGDTFLNFSSNDYLGLSDHKSIRDAWQQGTDKFGSSASASSLVTGYHYAHKTLEDTICEWVNKPKCLLFSSGFAANSGVLQALGQENCLFLLDKLSHASLIDGAYASSATVKRYRHNHVEQLEKLLDSSHLQNKLIVTEGVFSMDGDKASLTSILTLAKKFKAATYVDDAHSIGVHGNMGQGSSSEGNIDIVMATFGKAIATSGAFVACDNDVYDYLVNFAKHYIYSTALPPALAWATNQSIKVIQKESWRRDKISELSELFQSLLDQHIEIIPTESSIHGVVIGSEEDTLEVAEKLRKKGIWLTAMRPPTVPYNSSRLRVTITAAHNYNDIKYLAKSINGSLAK